MKEQGRVDWPKYWASFADLPPNLTLTSVQLESLTTEIRDLPVTTLNLGKAGKPLRDAGIKTLGELLATKTSHLRRLQGTPISLPAWIGSATARG